jgi:hypothetical protein
VGVLVKFFVGEDFDAPGFGAEEKSRAASVGMTVLSVWHRLMRKDKAEAPSTQRLAEETEARGLD